MESQEFRLASFAFAFGGMEGTPSDTEKGDSLSGAEGEHHDENFVLDSFADCKCSPLLQGFLHEEELCKVALTCHFLLEVLFLSQD